MHNNLLYSTLFRRQQRFFSPRRMATAARIIPFTSHGMSRLSFSTLNSNTTNDTTNNHQVFNKIAFVGAGMMAKAVLQPVIQKHIQPASHISVFDVNVPTLEKLRDEYNDIQCAECLPDCLADADLVILCVKPQNLTPSFWQEVQRTDNTDKILLSVIAGQSIQTFVQGGFSKIIRSMPNTPATIGRGMTVWSATDNLTRTERKQIKRVLDSCGKSMFVDDERFIDMATSISGSGPAYIFMLMESMIDAGVHMGLPRNKATTLVYETMLGSTIYAMETKEHPAILRNRVTSPSGTTASALYELEHGRFRTTIKNSMWACYRRSLEMGNHDSNVGPGRHVAASSHDVSDDSE